MFYDRMTVESSLQIAVWSASTKFRYHSEFEKDATAVEQIDKGFAQVKEFIADLDSEGTERERDDDFYGRGSGSITGQVSVRFLMTLTNRDSISTSD